MLPTKLVISSITDPHYNLALEDWALKNADTSGYNYLLLYVNRPSVIIGRNQNLFEEVNINYCKNNNIEVARRISGGGTVFHDIGNLNWSYISAFDSKKVNKYEWAAKLIIDLLRDFGLKAYLTERNAIEVDGLKVSGQAQFTNRKNILSHGTLLINSNLKLMQPAIEMANDYKIESKASKSVRSNTTNLSALLGKEISVEEVISKIKAKDTLSEIDWHPRNIEIDKFKEAKWLFARSPKFIAKHFINGETIDFEVEKAIIRVVKNEKGHLLEDSPFLNQTYEKFLDHFSN